MALKEESSTMTTTIRPTREARRLHLSHLSTTHRAPLSGQKPTGVRARGTFTPMTRDSAVRTDSHTHHREA